MKSVIRALAWELLRKNWVVFPGLTVLWAIGLGLMLAIHDRPGAWWITYARQAAVLSFLTSSFIALMAFSLMETIDGWRSTSVAARWFALPTRTGVLVTVPLCLAGSLMLLLVAVWHPLLSRLLVVWDPLYLAGIFLAGIASTQFLAWCRPVRAGGALYPLLVGLGVWIPIVAALWPWLMHHWEPVGLRFVGLVLGSVGVTGLAARWAGNRNRRGDWPESFLLGWRIPAGLKRHARAPEDGHSSPVRALFRSDVWRGFWPFALGYVGFVTLLVMVAIRMIPPENLFSKLPLGSKITGILIQFLPFLGIFLPAWLTWLLSSEPGTPFRTRIPASRAALPVTSGMLAGTRLNTLILAWSTVWIPTLVLFFLCRWQVIDQRTLDGAPPFRGLAWSMAVSANALVGVLPLYLRGRPEGFSLFFASLVGAFWSMELYWWFSPIHDLVYRGSIQSWAIGCTRIWRVAAVLLIIGKFAVTGWALIESWRQRYITWRFAVVMAGGWLGVVGGLNWLMPAGLRLDPWNIVGLIALVPLARLALCPLAVAANRHR